MTRDLILLVADRDTGEVMEGGEPSGLQIVPKEFDTAMLRAWAAASYKDGVNLDESEYRHGAGAGDYPIPKWRHMVELFEVPKRTQAMLSASRVDLTKAEVKLPEPSEGTEGPDDYGDGRNEVIRDIQAQMKGE